MRLAFLDYAIECQWSRYAFEFRLSALLKRKQPLDQVRGRRTDQYFIGIGRSLDTSSNIGSLAQGEYLALLAAADLANDD